MSSRSFTPVTSVADITPDTVTERLSYRLNTLVGTGRRWSYFGVAARTLIDVRTLKAYVQGTACPSLVKYKQLLAVLGPEIGIEFNIMKGWPPRSAVMPPDTIDLVELRARLLQSLSVIGEVLGASAEGAGAGDDELVSQPHEPDGIETLAEFRRPLVIEAIDAAAVAARLGYRLQKIIGPGRSWALADLSDATGIDRRTLQSYIAGEACPNLTRYHRLGFVLGPQVGVELAYMIGWEPRYRDRLQLPLRQSEALERSLRNAVDAINDLLGAADDHDPVRLIRRNDHVDEHGRGDTTVPPLRVISEKH